MLSKTSKIIFQTTFKGNQSHNIIIYGALQYYSSCSRNKSAAPPAVRYKQWQLNPGLTHRSVSVGVPASKLLNSVLPQTFCLQDFLSSCCCWVTAVMQWNLRAVMWCLARVRSVITIVVAKIRAESGMNKRPFYWNWTDHQLAARRPNLNRPIQPATNQ